MFTNERNLELKENQEVLYMFNGQLNRAYFINKGKKIRI